MYHRFMHHPFIHASLSLWLAMAVLTSACAVSYSEPQPEASKKPAVEKPVAKKTAPKPEPKPTASTTDPFVDKLGAITWQPVPKDSMKLSYEQALRRAADKNLDIRISLAKIDETEAKQASVENKRVLFFFKYFNSEYFEGSAESDVMAAKQHQLFVRNKALLDASTYYFDLMRSVMGTYISHQAIRQGLKQLQFNQSQFDSGETTSFDVMQTKTELVHRYQDFLQSSITNEDASLRLSKYLGIHKTDLLYPNALTYENDKFNIQVFDLFPDDVTEKQVVYLAKMNRPDLKELEYRKDSIENLLKANSKQFDKNNIRIIQATLKQMELKYEKGKRAVEASATKAYSYYKFSDRKITLAKKQMNLASTALRQVQISHKAGFSSNKDVLDAQVAYAQAQVNEANALIDYNLSQIQLLYETGLINLETLLKTKTTPPKTNQKTEHVQDAKDRS